MQKITDTPFNENQTICQTHVFHIVWLLNYKANEIQIKL